MRGVIAGVELSFNRRCDDICCHECLDVTVENHWHLAGANRLRSTEGEHGYSRWPHIHARRWDTLHPSSSPRQPGVPSCTPPEAIDPPCRNRLPVPCRQFKRLVTACALQPCFPHPFGSPALSNTGQKQGCPETGSFAPLPPAPYATRGWQLLRSIGGETACVGLLSYCEASDANPIPLFRSDAIWP
jgi:hypothetical protein